MARLSIRVKFNEGRVGVPLAKLGNVVGEVRQFLDMLAADVEISGALAEWQGFDFENESLSFVASRPIEEEDKPKVREFNEAVSDITRRRRNPRVRSVTLAQYASIAKPIDHDEAVRFGIYDDPTDELVDQRGIEPREWLDLTKDKAAAIAREIQAVVKAYGSVQGVIHSIFFGSQPPHFQIRELSTGNLIKCVYRQEVYDQIAVALHRRNAVVHAYGLMRTNMIDNKCESLALDRIDLAQLISDEELEHFLGGAPGILGDQDLQQFIDEVRNRGE